MRTVFLKNDYERGLFNGMLGRIEALHQDGEMTVSFDSTTHRLSPFDRADIDLAYAVTIHKAQGSQFRRVIVPIVPSRLLDRTLVYTAITRAQEQVVLVGDRGAFEAAVQAVPHPQRRAVGIGSRLIRSCMREAD